MSVEQAVKKTPMNTSNEWNSWLGLDAAEEQALQYLHPSWPVSHKSVCDVFKGYLMV